MPPPAPTGHEKAWGDTRVGQLESDRGGSAMRKLLLTGALVALLATPILAQRPGGGRPDFTVFLLANKTVQDELKLTDKQKDALKKAEESVKKARDGGDVE